MRFDFDVLGVSLEPGDVAGITQTVSGTVSSKLGYCFLARLALAALEGAQWVGLREIQRLGPSKASLKSKAKMISDFEHQGRVGTFAVSHILEFRPPKRRCEFRLKVPPSRIQTQAQEIRAFLDREAEQVDTSLEPPALDWSPTPSGDHVSLPLGPDSPLPELLAADGPDLRRVLGLLDGMEVEPRTIEAGVRLALRSESKVLEELVRAGLVYSFSTSMELTSSVFEAFLRERDVSTRRFVQGSINDCVRRSRSRSGRAKALQLAERAAQIEASSFRTDLPRFEPEVWAHPFVVASHAQLTLDPESSLKTLDRLWNGNDGVLATASLRAARALVFKYPSAVFTLVSKWDVKSGEVEDALWALLSAAQPSHPRLVDRFLESTGRARRAFESIPLDVPRRITPLMEALIGDELRRRALSRTLVLRLDEAHASRLLPGLGRQG